MSNHYQLPPEWAPQSGVMLTWPHRESYWVDTLDAIDEVFVSMAHAISRFEKVLISCLDTAHQAHIKKLLTQRGVNLANILLFVARADDIWVRDHGPITVLVDGKPRILDFTFNGWGNKYSQDNDNVNDNQLTHRLEQLGAFGKTPVERIEFVLEGGSIEVDGHGTLLTTKSCLISALRNPDLTQEKIEADLKNYLGVERILWLANGYLAGDDTDGHIDTLARFTDASTICYMHCDDPTDDHYTALSAMEAELKTFKDYRGQPYRLVPLPWPKPRFADFDGRRLPVTYANFLIINGAVIVPTYDDPADEKALKILGDCFPGREIIGINAIPVVQWYGSLHCKSMQLPSGVLA